MTLLRVQPPVGMNNRALYDEIPKGQGLGLLNVVPGQARTEARAAAGTLQNLVVGPTTPDGAGFWTNVDTVLHVRQAGGFNAWVAPAGANTPIAAPAGAVGTLMSRSFAEMGLVSVGPLSGTAQATLMTWNGAAGTLVALTTGPRDVQAVCQHQSRLFALGGSKPGTVTPTSVQRLSWTIPNPVLTGNVLSDWSDPVSGLVNEITLPPGDTYTDIVTMQRTLYVIGRQSIIALTGDTPSSFSVRKVLDRGTSVTHAGHATVSDMGLYFKSGLDLMRFDGAQPFPVNAGFAYGFNDGWFPLADLGNGFVTVASSLGWLVLHERSGMWARYTAVGLASSNTSGPWSGSTGIPAFVRRTKTYLLAFDIGQPNAGGVIHARDISLCFFGGQPEAGATVQIDGRLERLGSPERRATVRRMFADTYGGDWKISLSNRNAAEPSSGPGIFTAVIGGAHSDIRMTTSDNAFGEVDGFIVQWVLNGNPRSETPCIGDVHVEFDAAQQR